MNIKNFLKTIQISVFSLIIFQSSSLYAACSGTTRTWDGSTNNRWGVSANWDSNNVPDTATEDAVIVSGDNNVQFRDTVTIGCLHLYSGEANSVNNRTVTITGDEFYAAPTTMAVSGANFKFMMGGSSPQTVDVTDDVRDFGVSNTTSVTLLNSFRVLNDLDLSGSGTTYVEGDLTLNNTSGDYIIPAGHTVVIRSTGSIFSRNDFIVNGTLKIEGGGEFRIYRNKDLIINSGGILELDGSDGNPARVVSEASNQYFNS